LRCKPTVLVRALVLDRDGLVTWMVTSMGVVEFETETSFEAFEAFPSQGQLFLY
jgi:ligand-binding sensor domain-containing protein